MIENYLLPIIKDLKELELGVQINNYWYRFFLLFVVADKPARALILNMKLASSYYGCLKCDIKGESVVYGNGKHIIFNNNRISADRTKENYQRNVITSNQYKKPSKGIKGRCLLSVLKYFEPIRCTNIDLMHSIYLGVCKMLFFYWFVAPMSNKFSLKSKLNELNKKLSEMKPPNFIQQAPRKLEDYKNWRSHEFMNFFLFFALPLFQNIMDENYFKHLVLFVTSLEMLISKRIKRSDLPIISANLKNYVIQAEILYDKHFINSGVHELNHLVKCTIEIGPLNIICCFQFEELNRKVTRFIKGQDLVGDEFIKSWTVSKNLALHISKMYSDDDENKIIIFIKEHFALRSSNLKKKNTGFNVLKMGQDSKLENTKLEIATEKIGFLLRINSGQEIYFFKSIKINNCVYTTTEVNNKFSNCCIKYNNQVGFIENIFSCNESVYFFVKKLTFLNYPFNFDDNASKSHFAYYYISNNYFLIEHLYFSCLKKLFYFKQNNFCLVSELVTNHLFS